MKILFTSAVFIFLLIFRDCISYQQWNSANHDQFLRHADDASVNGRKEPKGLSEKVVHQPEDQQKRNVTSDSVADGDEYGEFQVIQSNVLQVKTLPGARRRTSRTRRDLSAVLNRPKTNVTRSVGAMFRGPKTNVVRYVSTVPSTPKTNITNSVSAVHNRPNTNSVSAVPNKRNTSSFSAVLNRPKTNITSSVLATTTPTPPKHQPNLHDSSTAVSGRADKMYKHGHKKKKKKHSSFYKLLKKLQKLMPKFMKKMMPMMKGPSMFFMGMAQANLNNFVMHALMMSKWALTSVVIMLIREIVFGDKDHPVKYYNYGYDHYHPVRRRVITTTYHHHDYKRRRRRDIS